jgi:hypothetical protein
MTAPFESFEGHGLLIGCRRVNLDPAYYITRLQSENSTSEYSTEDTIESMLMPWLRA